MQSGHMIKLNILKNLRNTSLTHSFVSTNEFLSNETFTPGHLNDKFR